MAAPQIVTVNVSVNTPPTPNTLQQTGAFISQGATNLAVDGTHLLTQLSDLTSILTGALALSSLSWSGSVVTATTAAPHGFTTSDVIPLTIAGAAPSGYNGTFQCTITGASTFTYPLVSDPGSETIPGTYTPEDVAELVAMATTFFAQGSSRAVYVLELGAGSAADGVTALTSYMANHPNAFYAYLTPRSWADESTFVTLCNQYTSTTAKQYFHITATKANYTSFATIKSAFVWIEAPGIPATEFSAAADFYVTLNYQPSSTNKVPPNSYAFLFGVTAYPETGGTNAADLVTFQTDGVNVVRSAAEGGLSNTMVWRGTFMDLNPFNFWFSVDWHQINLKLDLANAVIEGSNNTVNPLYYDQPGIDSLQAVGANTLARGISYGLAVGQLVTTTEIQSAFVADFNAGDFLGQVVINAVPFQPYITLNPTDYQTGVYGGFSAVLSPARGFTQIIFNLDATSFA